MFWQNLEQKHEQEWIDFEKLRIAAWDRFEANRKAIYAAFGDKEENIPDWEHDKVNHGREEWQALWGENGMREKYLRTLQSNERDAMKTHVKSSILEQLRTARENTRMKSKDRDRED